MKKITTVLMAAAMTMAMLAGCGSASTDQAASAEPAADTETAAAEENQEETAGEAQEGDRTTFTVGFDAEFPPYGYMDENGDYTGFDLDLAQEVCDRNGWELVKQPIDWDSKDMELSSGSIDCIWNGFTMEGREDDYTFSEPYMLNEQVLVVKKDAGIKSWDDLAGKTVITQTDSAAQDVLEGDQKDLAATFATLDTIGEYNTAFMQLESGAVDAVACDLSIAQYQLAAKPDAYTQLDEPLSSEHYAVGFKKGDTKSADAVTESLKALYEDGTVKDLCDKYSSYGLSFDNWVLK